MLVYFNSFFSRFTVTHSVSTMHFVPLDYHANDISNIPNCCSVEYQLLDNEMGNEVKEKQQRHKKSTFHVDNLCALSVSDLLSMSVRLRTPIVIKLFDFYSIVFREKQCSCNKLIIDRERSNSTLSSCIFDLVRWHSCWQSFVVRVVSLSGHEAIKCYEMEMEMVSKRKA